MNDRRDDEFEGRDADIACAFCGKQPHQVAAMISGPNGIYICDECISVCADAMMRDLGLSVPGHDEAAMAEGFSHAEAELLARVLPEDLNKYGMIPEFVGRIPVVTSLNELSEEDLVRILTEPKNALVKQYTKMFEFEDSVLTFEPEALKAIAHEAVEHGTGARGLRSICERVLQDVMYDLPEQKGPSTVTIRATDITGETKPDIEPTDGAEALPAGDAASLQSA